MLMMDFRQSNKEAKKEEAILLEKKELVNTINDLALQLERQDAQLREINRVVADLGKTCSHLLVNNVMKMF